jgi:hypothetical protein
MDFWTVSNKWSKGGETAMRLSVTLLALTVLLVAGFASAGTMSSVDVPEEVKASPPPGSYWSEELGVFVFDPPVVLETPELNLLSYEYQLYYDDSKMYYAVYQQPEYFVLTRFETPQVPSGWFEIGEIWVACVNQPGFDPKEGHLIFYEVVYTDACPTGEIGEELKVIPFVGEPYTEPEMPNVGDPPTATWTILKLQETVLINVAQESEFWLAWDYNPCEPADPSGYYISGDPMHPGMRFFENMGGACPWRNGYGPWLLHVFGNELPGPPKHIDIKTTSCPNPIKPGEIGDVQVGIIASADWLLSGGVDPESFYLRVYTEGGPDEGELDYLLPPYKWNSEPEDLTEPVYQVEDDCECTEAGPDGLMDWSFRFHTSDVWDVLLQQYPNMLNEHLYKVEFEWKMNDGVEMVGRDCFWVNIPGFDYGQQIGGGEPTLAANRVGEARGFALYQNAPNPFRGETTVSFSIPSSSHTTLTVHDVSGRTVATLVDGELSAGTHAVEWDASVPSGVYFCRLVAGGETAGARMVVAR